MAKYSAFGASIAVGNSDNVATATYTTVAQVKNISFSGEQMDTIDVTTHDSTDGFREFVEGLVDPGEVTIDWVYDPDEATHANAAGGLVYELYSRTKKAYKVTLSDTSATTIAFQAFSTSTPRELPVDGAMTGQVTLKLTGTLTWS